MPESNLKTISQKVITDWWNDCCRKDWRISFADPTSRNVLLRELAERLLAETKLGGTGKYPQGKLGEDDEGELRIAIAADKRNKKVAIDFGKSVKWLAFDADTAENFSNALREKIMEIR